MLAVTLLDFILPSWLVARTGGSTQGVRGSIIGMIAGVVFPMLGIIIGTIMGAIIGELVAGNDLAKSIRCGFVTFVGTMLNTGLKFLVASSLAILFLISLIRIF